MIFHVIFTTTVLAVLVHLWRIRSAGLTLARVVRVSLLHLLSIQWGFGAAWIALPHIVFPDQVAGFIGWAPGSPFQVELGFATLGMSCLGILSIWLRGWFWLAPVVSWSVFSLGATYVHVEDILAHGNLSPGNAGAILFYDAFVPLLAIALLVVHFRNGGLESTERTARSG